MVRGGISDLPIDVHGVLRGRAARSRLRRLAAVPRSGRIAPRHRFEDAVRGGDFDYVMLFESSGMYRGEDLAVLASHLVIGRLDAVWGSRRLSVRDIAESIRFRYQKTPLFGAISAVGQPRAEPGVPLAVRPLHLGHAVGGARDPSRRCAEH